MFNLYFLTFFRNKNHLVHSLTVYFSLLFHDWNNSPDHTATVLNKNIQKKESPARETARYFHRLDTGRVNRNFHF